MLSIKNISNMPITIGTNIIQPNKLPVKLNINYDETVRSLERLKLIVVSHISNDIKQEDIPVVVAKRRRSSNKTTVVEEKTTTDKITEE